MKQDRWLKDLAKGMFYLPDDPSNEVPGIVVNRGGRYQLELIGTFSKNSLHIGEPSISYPCVCGWLSEGGPVTLVGCWSSFSIHAPGMNTERCSFSYALKGHSFLSANSLRFAKVNAYISGLSAWLGVGGVTEEFEFELDSSKLKSWLAKYVQPERLTYELTSEVTLVIHFTFKKDGSAQSNISFEVDCGVEVACASEKDLLAIRKFVYGFQLLLMLFSGRRMDVAHNAVYSNQVIDPGGERLAALPIFFNDELREEKDQDIPHWFDFFIPFSAVKNDFQNSLRRWSDMLELYGEAVGTSLFDSPQITLQTRFLNLTNSLHQYVETDSNKRVSLIEALRQLLEPYCTQTFTSSVLKKIESSRHYYTHYNPLLAAKAAVGADLANMVDFLDMINRCALLERLGFSRDQVKDWISKSHRFNDRLSMNRWKGLP
jgi:hypothetical protein